jgi:hypothetical protein
MKYSFVMDSVAVIYTPSLIKFGSVIQEYMREDYTDEQHGDCTNLLGFLHNKKG